MKQTPFEYVGKTLMNLFLVYEKDPKYKSLMTELNLELSLQLLLSPIIDPDGPEASYMIDTYRKLSRVVQLDKLNAIGYSPDFDSLYWQDENEMTGPRCGNCGAPTRPILYGMPGEDFDHERFEVGGCVVSESDPIWLCRECGWQI